MLKSQIIIRNKLYLRRFMDRKNGILNDNSLENSRSKYWRDLLGAELTELFITQAYEEIKKLRGN